MEKVIFEHVKVSKRILRILRLFDYFHTLLRIRKTDNTVSIRMAMGKLLFWAVEGYTYFGEISKLNEHDLVSFSIRNDIISIQHGRYTINWDKGVVYLIKYIPDFRSAIRVIRFYGESKLITIKNISIIYDLKNFLTYTDTPYQIEDENLFQNLANGEFHLLEAEDTIIAYMDTMGKVNIIDFYLGDTEFKEYEEYLNDPNNINKLIVELEELKENYLTYNPEIPFIRK